MLLSQPFIPSIPPRTDLTGQVIIVTGATRGLGYEASLQFLRLKASTVILAVRDVIKGYNARKDLLSDAEIRQVNPNASIHVLPLDLSDFTSVIRFAKLVRERVSRLDVLLLNAGINLASLEFSKSGHEILMQVNYLSNALLALLLLPLLQKTPCPPPSSTLHIPTITFVGSMGHAFHSLTNFPVHNTTAIIPYYDDPSRYSRFSRYPDTKFFVALFVRALAERLPLMPFSPGAEAERRNVIVNNGCPGTVDTTADDNLPWYLRIPMNLNRRIRARTVPEGARALVHATVFVGTKSHGGYISNNKVKPLPPFANTLEGILFGEKLWDETLGLMLDVDAGAGDGLPHAS